MEWAVLHESAKSTLHGQTEKQADRQVEWATGPGLNLFPPPWKGAHEDEETWKELESFPLFSERLLVDIHLLFFVVRGGTPTAILMVIMMEAKVVGEAVLH